MRNLVYFIATSIDGFIAREDGSLDDFAMGGEHFEELLREYPETIPGHLREQLNVNAENRHFDAVLMGRRTHEVGLEFGVTNPYPHLDQYVFSNSLPQTPDESVALVGQNPLEHVRQLKKQNGKDIWLCGGGSLAAALFREIDEIILKVNPFLMGRGLALFNDPLPRTELKPKDKKVYDNGFMLLHYTVDHN